MPTVHRFRGMRVVIYPNDHLPVHVHVLSSDAEALFFLNCPSGPVELRENYGFLYRQILRIAHELDEQITRLCAAWKEIHDNA